MEAAVELKSERVFLIQAVFSRGRSLVVTSIVAVCLEVTSRQRCDFQLCQFNMAIAETSLVFCVSYLNLQHLYTNSFMANYQVGKGGKKRHNILNS